MSSSQYNSFNNSRGSRKTIFLIPDVFVVSKYISLHHLEMVAKSNQELFHAGYIITEKGIFEVLREGSEVRVRRTSWDYLRSELASGTFFKISVIIPSLPRDERDINLDAILVSQFFEISNELATTIKEGKIGWDDPRIVPLLRYSIISKFWPRALERTVVSEDTSGDLLDILNDIIQKIILSPTPHYKITFYSLEINNPKPLSIKNLHLKKFCNNLHPEVKRLLEHVAKHLVKTLTRKESTISSYLFYKREAVISLISQISERELIKTNNFDVSPSITTTGSTRYVENLHTSMKLIWDVLNFPKIPISEDLHTIPDPVIVGNLISERLNYLTYFSSSTENLLSDQGVLDSDDIPNMSVLYEFIYNLYGDYVSLLSNFTAIIETDKGGEGDKSEEAVKSCISPRLSCSDPLAQFIQNYYDTIIKLLLIRTIILINLIIIPLVYLPASFLYSFILSDPLATSMAANNLKKVLEDITNNIGLDQILLYNYRKVEDDMIISQEYKELIDELFEDIKKSVKSNYDVFFKIYRPRNRGIFFKVHKLQNDKKLTNPSHTLATEEINDLLSNINSLRGKIDNLLSSWKTISSLTIPHLRNGLLLTHGTLPIESADLDGPTLLKMSLSILLEKWTDLILVLENRLAKNLVERDEIFNRFSVSIDKLKTMLETFREYIGRKVEKSEEFRSNEDLDKNLEDIDHSVNCLESLRQFMEFGYDILKQFAGFSNEGFNQNLSEYLNLLSNLIPEILVYILMYASSRAMVEDLPPSM